MPTDYFVCPEEVRKVFGETQGNANYISHGRCDSMGEPVFKKIFQK
jgi:hypothetical protein